MPETLFYFNTTKFNLIKIDTTNWIKTPYGLMSPELYREFLEYIEVQNANTSL
jgi:hypothetical protein